MATKTKKTTNKTTKKPTKKTTSRKPKKATGKNVDYYEIKLILLAAFTVLSVFSLHTNLVGPVGAFIKSIYFGLFSFAGYFLPYIVLIGFFYKINNRLIAFRRKTIVGLVLLFLSLLFLVNILNFDVMNSKFLEPDVSLFSFTSLKTLFTDGVSLIGSGLIGGIIGKLFISLVNVTGLYILIATLWVISFVLITNVKLSVWFKDFFSQRKADYDDRRENKEKAKVEYLKESEKLEAQRIKEQEKIKKIREKERSERSQQHLDKALNKVDKKLKAEERVNQKKLEEYDAIFQQSPTKSLVDKLMKKTAVPSKAELKNKVKQTKEQENAEEAFNEQFSQFDSKGYVFDDKYEQDTIVEQAPDIFDNHLDANPSDTDVEITGFGTLIEDGIKKAYKDSDLEVPGYLQQEQTQDNPVIPEPTNIESNNKPAVTKSVQDVEAPKNAFDEAFKQAEAVKHTEGELFENGTPMSDEEKANVLKFDQMLNGQPAQAEPQYEESSIPDAAIVQHMSESVRLEYENYRIPEVTVLKKNQNLNQENKAALFEKARLLEEILANFNVDAKVIQISKGPAITRYEIQLKPGTKMSKITNLSDDIALNLATQQVRIAAVPGKAAVGIEVPNDQTSIVTLREVLDSKVFEESDSKLSAGLGKNISGAPIIADLAKMPHMLIAGATGSGKSVCVNTLITSILLNSKPDEVKFLMIDPKVVELSNYNGIPHLILPVVTDPKKASVALNWAVQEMTKRYNAFAENSVRDIKGFNKKFGHDKTKFMPQIVVIIDELADLMMVAPNQVEDAICRLAQMARAAGIHLIVATQRPSVDVITGVIKANIPSRIAFAVSSAIDSRTIIDMSGAEKLLGKGDMLYYPVGSSKPQRIQGAFIADEEVEDVVSAVKNQFSTFSYDETILNDVSNTIQSTQSEDSDDEHLASAIKLVVEMEQASISMLQRKFKIGYNRAARIVDEMEARGVVGPSQGSKPRTVLLTKADLEG